MTQIFISHSHEDKPLSDLLLNFIQKNINISYDQIRCTSSSAYSYLPGESIPASIKTDLNDSTIVLGLITLNSMMSEYVLFELGAGWGQGKAVAILGPDIGSDAVPEPIRECKHLSVTKTADMFKLIDRLQNDLNTTRPPMELISEYVSDFVKEASTLKLVHTHKHEIIHPVPGRKYHGKEFFKIWPQTMLIEDKFWSVSMMSVDYWKSDEAVMGLFALGGVRRVRSDASIRRIFVVDNLDEITKLEKTFELHLDMNIEVAYILNSEYRNICENSCKILAGRFVTDSYCIKFGSFLVANLNYVSEFPENTCLINFSISEIEREISEFTASNNIDAIKDHKTFFRYIWENSATPIKSKSAIE